MKFLDEKTGLPCGCEGEYCETYISLYKICEKHNSIMKPQAISIGYLNDEDILNPEIT